MGKIIEALGSLVRRPEVRPAHQLPDLEYMWERGQLACAGTTHIFVARSAPDPIKKIIPVVPVTYHEWSTREETVVLPHRLVPPPTGSVYLKRAWPRLDWYVPSGKSFFDPQGRRYGIVASPEQATHYFDPDAEIFYPMRFEDRRTTISRTEKVPRPFLFYEWIDHEGQGQLAPVPRIWGAAQLCEIQTRWDKWYWKNVYGKKIVPAAALLGNSNAQGEYAVIFDPRATY